MPKYRISAALTISVYTDVEASSAKEAKELAMDRAVIGLCHQCGDDRLADEQWVTSGELDGEPVTLSAEKVHP